MPKVHRMRRLLFLPSCLLPLVLLYLPPQSFSEVSAVSDPTSLPAGTQAQMIVVNDSGLEPRNLTISKKERVAFFLNNTKESLITLDVQFGSNTTHCASENLQIYEDGGVRSIKPVVPKDFATTCFHDAGTYPFTVRGVASSLEGLRGVITVQ